MTRMNVPAGQPVTVHYRLQLAYNITSEEKEVWSQQRTIARGTRRVTDGRGTINETVNVTRLQNRLEPAIELVGAGGTANAALNLTVRYETNRYSGTLNDSTPLSIRETVYSVDGNLTDGEVRSEPVVQQRTRPPDPLTYGPLVFTGMLCLVGTIWTVQFNRRDIDAQSVRYDAHRNRYAEWISEGMLPEEFDGNTIEMRTLEDLTDVAIDSHKRVIYDHERNAYGVIDENLLFYFIDPTEEEADLEVIVDSG